MGLHTLHLETVCDTAQTWLHTYALGRDPIFATISSSGILDPCQIQMVHV
jgi:hypothetical protein